MRINEIIKESGQSILDRAKDLGRTADMNYSDGENMLELERMIDRREQYEENIRALRMELAHARQRQSREEPASWTPPPPEFDDDELTSDEWDDYNKNSKIPPPP